MAPSDRFHTPRPRRFAICACVALAMAAALPAARGRALPSQSPAAATRAVAGASPAPEPAIAVRLPFSRLGAFRPIQLTGTRDTGVIGLGIRLDRVVTRASLHLVYTYSPALLPSVSQIRVLFNQQVVASIPLRQQAADDAGKVSTVDVALDPRLFTGFNQIALQLVGHYTMDHCEDPANTAIWADISPSSLLAIDERPVALADDLALLPAPFFDEHDNTRLVLPFMLGGAPDDELLRSAGILASWFGKLAGYRGARFPVATGFPTSNNVVLLGTPASLPASLKIGPIQGPTIMVRTNPAAPDRKVLLILGRNDAEVRNAVYGLVLGQMVLSGASAQVGRVDIGPPRKPYDAPKWVSMDGPVKFKDLVDDPAQLQVSGSAPDPIRIKMPVPADLFEWSGRGIPLDLKYRYTAPSVVNDSMLSVDINSLLVKSYRLSPRSPQKSDPVIGTLRLPLLTDSGSGVNSFIDIPSFRVGSANEMELRFSLESQRSGVCGGAGVNRARAAIDPDSTIDFSGLGHYAVMPNLAFFANSGYPYTRLADLADTDVVLPDHSDATDVETMLEVLGHMGDWTGLPALRFGIVRASQVRAPLDKDLIVIGSGDTAALLKGWNGMAPLRIAKTAAAHAGPGPSQRDGQRDQRVASAPAGSEAYTVSLVERRAGASGAPRERTVTLDQHGGLGAIVGMQSPFDAARSVVALIGTDAASLRNVSRVLADSGASGFINGDVAIVRDREVQSMRIGPQYTVGHLPWYARVWMVAAAHPLLLAVFSVLAGILVAMGLFVGFQSIAARRRGG